MATPTRKAAPTKAPTTRKRQAPKPVAAAEPELQDCKVCGGTGKVNAAVMATRSAAANKAWETRRRLAAEADNGKKAK
jgi:hypothetical protein